MAGVLDDHTSAVSTEWRKASEESRFMMSSEFCDVRSEKERRGALLLGVHAKLVLLRNDIFGRGYLSFVKRK